MSPPPVPGPTAVTVLLLAGADAAPWAGEAAAVVAADGPEGASLGVQVCAALAQVRTPLVVLAGGPGRPRPGWSAALGQAAGTVVAPLVVGPDEVVVECGTRAGVPLDAGLVATDETVLWARRTDGTTSGVLGVDRAALVRAGGPDPAATTVEALLAAVVADLVAAGGHARVAPGLVLDVDTAGPAADGSLTQARRRCQARLERSPERFLVLSRSLPELPPPAGQALLAEVLAFLVEARPDSLVTLLTPDAAPGSPLAAALRAAGVELVAGGRDWDRWFQERRFTYTHVLVEGAALEHRFSPLLQQTQPQAQLVFLTSGLEFRGPAALRPALQHPEEVLGLRGVAAVLRERVAATLDRADAVWCTSTLDRDFVRGVRPELACTVLHPGVPGVGDAPGFPARSGLAVLAGPGADVLQAHEDAAATAVEQVWPLLRARHPGTWLTVLSDVPSPYVLRFAEQAGVRVAPLEPDPAQAYAAVRLVLAPYLLGTGGRAAAAQALAHGVPFLLTPQAAQGVELGDLAELVVVPDVATMADRAHRLLGEPAVWEDHRRRVLGWRAATGPAVLRRELVAALAGLGVPPPSAPHRGRPAPPAPRPAPTVPPPMRPVPAAHQQLDRTGPRPGDTADEQYAAWVRARTPSEADLAALRDAVLAGPLLPVISIVVPTYETDAEVLQDMIRSVTAQCYPHWQLCLADDASPSGEPQRLLEKWAATDPRILVRLLEGNSGISGATNGALELATGEFVALLDHDDLLKPDALARVVERLQAEPDLDLLYSDEDKMDEHGRLVEPFFKPDWSPDHLMSRNYVGHLVVARRSLVEQVGGLRPEYDGSQDHDLLLRLVEQTRRIAHIAQPLYTWRRVPGSTAAVVDAKPYAFDAAKRALADALVRRGLAGTVEDGLLPSTYRTRYAIAGRPKVTVVIPTRDRVDLLRRCLDSIRERSTYDNLEFLVVDNDSTDPETLAYLATFGGRVVRYPHRFNYARMMNLGAWCADGDLLLFLNNDTEVIAPDWVEALIEHAQRPEVGAVGGRLLYPDDRPQHEGVVVNYAAGAAGNIDHGGWWGFGDVVRNCTAVTGAVTMMRPAVFDAVGGFQERLRVAFNDVDLCLRVRQAGFDVVYTPYCTLYHHESASRGFVPHPEDDGFFAARWQPDQFHDPFYNPNLDRSYPFRIHP